MISTGLANRPMVPTRFPPEPNQKFQQSERQMSVCYPPKDAPSRVYLSLAVAVNKLPITTNCMPPIELASSSPDRCQNARGLDLIMISWREVVLSVIDGTLVR